jgi:hypothetical protein
MANGSDNNGMLIVIALIVIGAIYGMMFVTLSLMQLGVL